MRRVGTLMLLLAMGLAGACSDNKGTEPPPPDPGLAARLVDSANDSLGSVMRTMLDSIVKYGDSTFRPSDLDFTGANALYKKAAAADPANMDAQFGAGFTEVLTFSGDPALSALYNRTKTWYDTTIGNPNWQLPVKMIMLPGGMFGPDMVPLGFPLTSHGVPALVPDLPQLDRALQATAATDPQPSDWQALLEASLLPRIQDAKTRLLTVAAHRDYVFWITPQMQGNLGADSIELDMTEVRVALAALSGLEAVMDVAVSRNLDIPAYSKTGLATAFNQGSDFLTLKPNGATKLAAAKVALFETLTQADSALVFLLQETDVDQSNDLIPQGSDASNILDSIRSAKTYLTQVKHFDLNIGGRVLSSDVDAAKFFDNPIQDPKTMLPYYTITFTTDTTFLAYEATHFKVQAYWDSLYSKFGVSYPNDTLVYPRHLPDTKNAQYYEVIGDCQCIWGWEDLHFNGGQADQCSNYDSGWQYSYKFSWDGRHGADVCLIWGNIDYASWNFPDPTLQGLFPNMTNNDWKLFIYPGGVADWAMYNCSTLTLP